MQITLAQEVLRTAYELIPSFLDFLNTQGEEYMGRYGGFISVRDGERGIVLACSVIGSPPSEKLEKYINYSFEKGLRLFRNPDDSTSHESRDESEEKYGGAVRGKNIIVSFSGFPERADSLFSLIVLYSSLSGCEKFIELADAKDLADAYYRYKEFRAW